MKYSANLLIFLSILGAGTAALLQQMEMETNPLIPQTMKPFPEPYRVRFDDGTETPLLRLKMRGEDTDSPEIYEETLDGFTVEASAGNQGKYTYRDVDMNTGEMIDTGLVAGADDPNSKNVHKHASEESVSLMEKMKPSFFKEQNNRKLRGSKDRADQSHRRTVITSGKLKNLVIPIRFADHAFRTLPSQDDLNVLMNNRGPATQCPTGSVRDTFLESSFNQLDIESTVLDWVLIDFTEDYCANGNSGLSTRIHQCLTNALDKVAGNINFQDFDLDDNGVIDGITFFHSGYAAEWGGNDVDGTSYRYRIWSHKWAIYSTNWSSNEVRVFEYHINPSLWARSGSSIGRIGVVAHETGHFLGLPDLYDYGHPTYGDGNGIGSWGLMANSWGFSNNQYNPPHMSAWGKYVLGWVSPTVVNSSGTYSIGRACDNADMIIIHEGYPSGEYLLIENRQRCGFETTIPQGGLAIFHIDNKANNILGHPNQSGWPTNGNHYKVALLQADGNYNLEKNNNRGDSGDLFHAGGVNSIGPNGISTGATHPNTKAYQGGTIVDTGVTISNISAAGSTMTFDITIGDSDETPSPTTAPTTAPTAAPTGAQTASPTASSTVAITAAPTATPTVSPTAGPSASPTTASLGSNLALGRPTTQSSTAHGGLSSRAVDGNTSGNWPLNSVTHTPSISNPSWSVSLNARYSINQINVFNREDCCTERLSGFKVIVWNGSTQAWTYTHGGGTPSRKTVVNVPAVDGDKVEVMIPGSSKILSLAEVEVFGTYAGAKDTQAPTTAPTVAPTASLGSNLALGRPTTQSSTAHGGVSSRAVDGNTSGNWRLNSVTHTPSISNPSWSVSLNARYSINQINVFNREDCCTGRLSGFKVIVWNGSTQAWTYTHGGGTPSRKTVVNVPAVDGDKVEVMIPGSSKILSLAEVEVFGSI